MRRYLIFGVLGPLLGGFILLLTATTYLSGYWDQPNASDVAKLLRCSSRRCSTAICSVSCRP